MSKIRHFDTLGFALAVRKAAAELGVKTISELARETDIPRSNLSSICNGRDEIGLVTVMKLATWPGVDPRDFWSKG